MPLDMIELERRVEELRRRQEAPIFNFQVAGGAGILPEKSAASLNSGRTAVLISGNQTLNDDILDIFTFLASLTAGSAGSIPYSTGSALAFSAAGTTGQALISGGTGAPTWFAGTQGGVLWASGASGILAATALGVANQLLKSNGTSAPSWTTVTESSGALAAITTISMSSTLTMTAAASQIIPGATSFAIRNNANTNDNLLVSDAGGVVIQNTAYNGSTDNFRIISTSTGSRGSGIELYFNSALPANGQQQNLLWFFNNSGGTRTLFGLIKFDIQTVTAGNEKGAITLTSVSGGAYLDVWQVNGNAMAINGVLSTTDATDTSSPTTGSVKMTGGLGVAKKIYAGDNIFTSVGSGTTGTIGLIQASNASWYIQNTATTGLFVIAESGVSNWLTIAKTTGLITTGGAFKLGGNIQLNSQYLSNDGGNEGISIDNSGNATVSGTLLVSGAGASIFNGALAAGTFLVRIVGTSGANRDLLLVGVTGVSDGFQVSYTHSGTQMNYKMAGLAAFAAGDKYLVADSNGNIHVSALGPAS